jgi:hypothetical protein
VKRILTTLALVALMPANAFAWGFVGHTMISRLGAENLPEDVPAWVRSPEAIYEISFLGPEEDRLRDAGASFDGDGDSGHFLDIGDDGTVAGVVHLDALPRDMAAYADALSKAGTTPYKVGFVPYTIMDGFERVRMDFAYWRVADYLATHAQTQEKRDASARERDLRQALTLRDIGDWSHFVGDGSQPLHITIHFNGWGNYPNPKGFTTKHIHAPFESAFVDKYSKIEDVRALIPMYKLRVPEKLLTQDDIGGMVGQYLAESARQVEPLYQLYASGDFDTGSPKAIRFTDEQLARGAAMLRNLITLAWYDSLNHSVGYPAVTVKDVLNGTVAPSSSD